jgi:hypothetical protein
VQVTAAAAVLAVYATLQMEAVLVLKAGLDPIVTTVNKICDPFPQMGSKWSILMF